MIRYVFILTFSKFLAASSDKTEASSDAADICLYKAIRSGTENTANRTAAVQKTHKILLIYVFFRPFFIVRITA